MPNPVDRTKIPTVYPIEKCEQCVYVFDSDVMMM